jgi:hypothetical protein
MHNSLERISLAGIARAVKVSEKWLQTYVNQKYALGVHPSFAMSINAQVRDRERSDLL